jgi:hypothetical protein
MEPGTGNLTLPDLISTPSSNLHLLHLPSPPFLLALSISDAIPANEFCANVISAAEAFAETHPTNFSASIASSRTAAGHIGVQLQPDC